MSRRHRNKGKMEDVDWQFVCDAVFGFLASPLWNLPVLTFMEENCLVFDPDDDQPGTYKEVHKKYKNMVDGLLSSFVKDIGITAEQFVQACTRTNTEQNTEFQKSMFEQILAAESYEIFKKLMVQKNIELQLQALRLIQQRSGTLPQSLVKSQEPQKAPNQTQATQAQVDEEALFQEVLRKSKEEYEAQQKGKSDSKEKDLHAKLEKDVVELAHVESKRLTEQATAEKKQLDKIVSASLDSQTALKTTSSPKPEKPPEKEALQTEKDTAKSKKDVPPITNKAPKTSAEAASYWLESAKAEAAASSTTATTAPSSSTFEDEIKQREEYLKQQRDKLLALKKQEREKKLDNFAGKAPSARPTSARTAKRVLTQNVPESAAEEPVNKEEEERKLAMRRALAARLKQEVINKH